MGIGLTYPEHGGFWFTTDAPEREGLGFLQGTGIEPDEIVVLSCDTFAKLPRLQFSVGVESIYFAVGQMIGATSGGNYFVERDAQGHVW